MLGLQRFAPSDLDCSHNEPSGRGVYVYAELGGDPGFFLRFDPVQPGIDENPFPDVGAMGDDRSKSIDGTGTSLRVGSYRRSPM